MQTQKCHQSIPKIFFKADLSPEEVGASLKLSKQPAQMQENIYELMDYSDEV